MYRTVVIGHRDLITKEGKCNDAGGILPGHLIDQNSDGSVFRQTKVGRVPLRVAIENSMFGKSGGLTQPVSPQQAITPDSYINGDQVIYQHLDTGVEFFGWVANNAPAIAYGDLLESDGAGGVKKSSMQGDQASLQLASTTSLASGITLTAKNGGADGNEISITVNAPGSAAISVTDTDITVTPATSSTIAQLVTQINGNATAAGLVTASSTDGTGAALAQASTKQFLTGGQDGGQTTAQMRALAALTNTSGGALQLRIEVL